MTPPQSPTGTPARDPERNPMTTHLNGTSRKRTPKRDLFAEACARGGPPDPAFALIQVEAEIVSLKRQLADREEKASKLGKVVAEKDPSRCRVCGRKVEASWPVVDPKGGTRVRRRCAARVDGKPCRNAWWTHVEASEETKR